jgi:hypothetical protein
MATLTTTCLWMWVAAMRATRRCWQAGLRVERSLDDKIAEGRQVAPLHVARAIVLTWLPNVIVWIHSAGGLSNSEMAYATVFLLGLQLLHDAMCPTTKRYIEDVFVRVTRYCVGVNALKLQQRLPPVGVRATATEDS